ncbi:MAG: riboflavin synthase [candidate division Zixibacteria bacterium]|nr:riboflavin synthase [candidate division Zixibacteria bacterium]
MFTGIIEEIGEIEYISSGIKSKNLKVKAEKVLKDLKTGDSVNISGACQTVIEVKQNSFVVQAVEETLKRSNLSRLKTGDEVNLERALRFSDRLGGHLLSGHIDCTAEIKSINSTGDSLIYEISFPLEYADLLVEKGSIAVEGISLTIAELKKSSFVVSVIPFTLKTTNLKEKKVKDIVNLEFDLLGKYVKKMLNEKEIKETKITEEWLREKL